MSLAWVLALWFAAAPPPWEKSKLIEGRDLYRENCAVCHNIESNKAIPPKLGPNLYHLFKNEKLPLSHGKPSRQYVAVRVKFGGALMPAFGKKLTDAQINTLIDYIESR